MFNSSNLSDSSSEDFSDCTDEDEIAKINSMAKDIELAFSATSDVVVVEPQEKKKSLKNLKKKLKKNELDKTPKTKQRIKMEKKEKKEKKTKAAKLGIRLCGKSDVDKSKKKSTPLRIEAQSKNTTTSEDNLKGAINEICDAVKEIAEDQHQNNSHKIETMHTNFSKGDEVRSESPQNFASLTQRQLEEIEKRKLYPSKSFNYQSYIGKRVKIITGDYKRYTGEIVSMNNKVSRLKLDCDNGIVTCGNNEIAFINKANGLIPTKENYQTRYNPYSNSMDFSRFNDMNEKFL